MDHAGLHLPSHVGGPNRAERRRSTLMGAEFFLPFFYRPAENRGERAQTKVG